MSRFIKPRGTPKTRIPNAATASVCPAARSALVTFDLPPNLSPVEQSFLLRSVTQYTNRALYDFSKSRRPEVTPSVL
jgi:hypothetical protein